MKILSPQISRITSSILDGRNSQAVFVRKHNLDVNVKAARGEIGNITRDEAHGWLFIVEGYGKYNTLENIYLDCLACELNIKAEDPIVNPFTEEVANDASVDKYLATLAVLVMDYLDLLEDNCNTEQPDNNTLGRLFDLRLETIGRAFDVSPKVIKKWFLKLQWDNEEKLLRQLIFLSEKRKDLIREGNLRSKTKLKEILEKDNHHNLFIMTGIEHATIFTH